MKKKNRTLGETLASLKVSFFGGDENAGGETATEEAATETGTATEEAAAETETATEEAATETETATEEAAAVLESARTDKEETATEEAATQTGKQNAADQMVQVAMADYKNLVSAAQKWSANEGEYNALKAWKTSMDKAGAGVGADAGDNNQEEKRVSRATQAAIKAYNKRKDRRGAK